MAADGFPRPGSTKSRRETFDGLESPTQTRVNRPIQNGPGRATRRVILPRAVLV